MVQIDMEMPKSCAVCPFNETGTCFIMPHVPAWINVSQYSDIRSEHCPLIEAPKKNYVLDSLSEEELFEPMKHFQD